MKPNFSEIYYDPKTVCWGHGNNIVGLRELARIRIREETPEEELELKSDYQNAESIYNQFINVNQKFAPGGKMANKDIIAKITGINSEHQYVSWKQTNTDELIKRDNFHYKPAKGKFNINAMIALIKNGEIVCL